MDTVVIVVDFVWVFWCWSSVFMLDLSGVIENLGNHVFFLFFDRTFVVLMMDFCFFVTFWIELEGVLGEICCLV